MKLQDLRKELGWSMEQLHLEADVSVDTIRRIERGEVTPRPSIVRRLAKALGVNPKDIEVVK